MVYKVYNLVFIGVIGVNEAVNEAVNWKSRGFSVSLALFSVWNVAKRSRGIISISLQPVGTGRVK